METDLFVLSSEQFYVLVQFGRHLGILLVFLQLVDCDWLQDVTICHVTQKQELSTCRDDRHAIEIMLSIAITVCNQPARSRRCL